MLSLKKLVHINANKFKNQRRGQSLMNSLYEVDRVVYDKITGTEADCFYDDGKIEAFNHELNKY